MGKKWIDTLHPFMPLNSAMMELTLWLTFVGDFGTISKTHRRNYIVSRAKLHPSFDEIIKHDAPPGARFVLIEDPDAIHQPDYLVGWYSYLQIGAEWVPVNWTDIKDDVYALVDSVTYYRVDKLLKGV